MTQKPNGGEGVSPSDALPPWAHYVPPAEPLPFVPCPKFNPSPWLWALHKIVSRKK